MKLEMYTALYIQQAHVNELLDQYFLNDEKRRVKYMKLKDKNTLEATNYKVKWIKKDEIAFHIFKSLTCLRDAIDELVVFSEKEEL